MFWLKSNPATRQPGTFKIILGLLWLCVLNSKAEMPYLKDFNAALTLAKQQGRIVILYTGRAELCLNNDPKAQFFQAIFKDHPKLAARAEQFVVCEHFGYAPSNDAQGNLTPGFFADTLKLDALFTRYDIRVFWPTVTFLEPNGTKLNGPFSYTMSSSCPMDGANELLSLGRDCYGALSDYEKAERPLRLNEAQEQLIATVTRPKAGEAGFAFLRCTYRRKGGAKPLLMESGVSSEQFTVGEPFNFAVRDALKTTYRDGRSQFAKSQVTVTGRFAGVEPVTETFLIRLNGVHFEARVTFAGSGPDYIRGLGDGVAMRPGEYAFGVETRSDVVADALLAEFKRLAAASGK